MTRSPGRPGIGEKKNYSVKTRSEKVPLLTESHPPVSPPPRVPVFLPFSPLQPSSRILRR